MAARGPQPQRRDPQRTVPPPPDSAGQRAVTRGIRGMGPQPKSAPTPGGYHWPTGGGSKAPNRFAAGYARQSGVTQRRNQEPGTKGYLPAIGSPQVMAAYPRATRQVTRSGETHYGSAGTVSRPMRPSVADTGYAPRKRKKK